MDEFLGLEPKTMAEDKKAAAAPAAKGDKKAAKGGAASLILGMALFGAATPFIFPSLLFLVGMLPTLVALFTETDRQRSSTIAIGAMNAAGILPFLIELWQKGQTLENAFNILSQSETWIVMLGAAALGQLIVFAIPQAIASLALARAESRITLLKHNLGRLKEVWGPDVATTKSLERIRRGE
jgi:hypothetical protein